jgi:hypothetical protein
MATVTPTRKPTNSLYFLTMTWVLTNTNVDGAPIDMRDYTIRTAQVFGTFNSATVVAQGSNDGGTTWNTLTDRQGNAVSFTVDGLKTIQDLPALLRPFSSGGTSGQNTTFALSLTKQQ